MKAKIVWYHTDTCGLVSKITGRLFVSADNEASLDKTLSDMTGKHPLYPELIKVFRNGDEAYTEIELTNNVSRETL